MSDIILIPFELVWEFGLSYIDIISLSMTCKHFRKLITNKHKMLSLIKEYKKTFICDEAWDLLCFLRKASMKKTMIALSSIKLRDKLDRHVIIKGSPIYRYLKDEGYMFHDLQKIFKVSFSPFTFSAVTTLRVGGKRRSFERHRPLTEDGTPHITLHGLFDLLLISDYLLFPDINFITTLITKKDIIEQEAKVSKSFTISIASSNKTLHEISGRMVEKYLESRLLDKQYFDSNDF